MFLLLTKGRIYLSLIGGDKASMLMTEKHREDSKKAASYSTLISSANHAIMLFLFFFFLFFCEQQTHSHSEYPMGERNYQVPQLVLQNSTNT